MNVDIFCTLYNYFKNKISLFLLVALLSMATQAIFLVSAEAKNHIDNIKSGNLNAYYAQRSQGNSDWHDLTEDYNVKNHSVPSQKEQKNANINYKNNIAPKKYRANKNIEKWNFPEKAPVYVNKWEHATRPEQMIQNAVAKVNKPKKLIASYSKRNTQSDNIQYTEPNDTIKINKNLRLKGRNDTIGFTFNNSKNIKADQQVYLNKTEVYGAYAEVYSEDDFSLAIGPEYSQSQTISGSRGDVKNDSDLGLGLQLMIGF